MLELLRGNLVRLRMWRGQSVNYRIVSSAALVGVVIVATKLISLVKDQLVAGRVGAGDDLDAFFVAILIPSFAIGVTATSMGTGLIPTYIRVREQAGPAAAGRLVASVLAVTLILLAAICTLLVAFAQFLLPLVAGGFTAEKLALTQSMFHVMVAILIISGVTGVFTAILNAGEKFVFPAAAPGLIPLVTIAVFLPLEATWGIHALAVGTLGGYLLELVTIVWAARRRGLFVLPRWNGLDADLRRVGRQYLLAALAAALMSSSVLIDQSMAASLGSGSVSVFNYGNKIVSLILGVGAISLSTAVLPHFSRMVALADWQAVRRTLNTQGRLVLACSIPLVGLLLIASEPLVRLLFERGEFTPDQTRLVSDVQRCAVLQIPFFTLGMMTARLLSAMNGNAILLKLGCVNIVVNVAGNYVFRHFFGVPGIAAATALMYLVSSVVLWKIVAIRLREQDRGVVT